MAKVLLFFINIVYKLLLLLLLKKKKNYSNACSNKPLVPLQLTSSSSTIPLHLLLLHNIPMQLTPLISQELLLQVQLEEFQQKKRLTWCSYLVPLSKQLQQLVPVIICTALKNKLCVQCCSQSWRFYTNFMCLWLLWRFYVITWAHSQ